MINVILHSLMVEQPAVNRSTMIRFHLEEFPSGYFYIKSLNDYLIIILMNALRGITYKFLNDYLSIILMNGAFCSKLFSSMVRAPTQREIMVQFH